MTRPSVLVGIVTRNRAAVLPKAVSSALSQAGCSIKVAVIDDGSTDGTASLAGSFRMLSGRAGPPVVAIWRPGTIG